jgi:hypothetical protein
MASWKLLSDENYRAPSVTAHDRIEDDLTGSPEHLIFHQFHWLEARTSWLFYPLPVFTEFVGKIQIIIPLDISDYWTNQNHISSLWRHMCGYMAQYSLIRFGNRIYFILDFSDKLEAQTSWSFDVTSVFTMLEARTPSSFDLSPPSYRGTVCRFRQNKLPARANWQRLTPNILTI